MVSARGRPVRLGLLLLLSIAGCQAESATCQLYRVNTFPISFSRNALIAEAAVNGNPLHLLVDTGSDITYLLPEAAKRVDLPVTSRFGLGAIGIGGRRAFDVGQARQFQLGALQFPNTGVGIIDFVVQATQPPIDGILGIDMLDQFDMDIDLVRKRLVFYQPGRACPAASHAMDPPLYSADLLPNQPHDGRPRVVVTINKQDFTAMLDTGAATTVLFKNAAERLALPSQPVSAGMLSGVGEGRVSYSRQAIKSIGIGDLEIDNLRIAIADQPSIGKDDMLLGRDVLARVHFWISQSSRTLIMQAPPQASHDAGQPIVKLRAG